MSDTDLLTALLKVGQERAVELAALGALDGPDIGAWIVLAKVGAVDEVPIPSAAFATDRDKQHLAEEFLPRVIADHAASAALLRHDQIYAPHRCRAAKCDPSFTPFGHRRG